MDIMLYFFHKIEEIGCTGATDARNNTVPYAGAVKTALWALWWQAIKLSSFRKSRAACRRTAACGIS